MSTTADRVSLLIFQCHSTGKAFLGQIIVVSPIVDICSPLDFCPLTFPLVQFSLYILSLMIKSNYKIQMPYRIGTVLVPVLNRSVIRCCPPPHPACTHRLHEIGLPVHHRCRPTIGVAQSNDLGVLHQDSSPAPVGFSRRTGRV